MKEILKQFVSNEEKAAESMYRSQKNYAGLIAQNIKLNQEVERLKEVKQEDGGDKWEVIELKKVSQSLRAEIIQHT